MSIPVSINGDSRTMASDKEFGTTHGLSCGMGFTISWQRGPLTGGRNGAFLLEVLSACQSQLEYYQTGKFASTENELALDNLKTAISHLERRLDRRQSEGVLGTHEPDIVQPAVDNTEPFYVSGTVEPAIAMEIAGPDVTILPTETTQSCGLGPK
jgi:hypothetical protein